MKKDKKIYLDHAATTPVDPRVLRVMLPYLKENFGNTMSLHSFGQKTKVALEKAREKIAKLMKADPEEIIFTGSATESNNLALKGIAWAQKNKGNHIIISQIEHPCILETARWLQKKGFKITLLPVDKFGFVSLRKLRETINKNTILVSIIQANNEIGTVEPIKKIAKICKENKVLFHTDAAQSLGKIPINVKEMNIDLLTGSSHKMYGPKGAACLFLREGIKLEPLLHGGGQEEGLRSSTHNVASIVGFGEACKICGEEMEQESKKQIKLRDKLIEGILSQVENSHLAGDSKKRLPNNICLWFDFIEGESLVMQLDLKGVAASTGSACSSAKLEPSHVLLAIGLKPEQAHGSLRLSLGRFTKEEDIDYLLKILPDIVKKLREISPYGK